MRDRTADLLDANQALSQLSYSPDVISESYNQFFYLKTTNIAFLSFLNIHQHNEESCQTY